MKVNEQVYDQDIHKLLDQYKASMDAHLKELDSLMEMQVIPIYTRWQELKATIRAFESLATQTDKTFNLLSSIHNSKNAEDN